MFRDRAISCRMEFDFGILFEMVQIVWKESNSTSFDLFLRFFFFLLDQQLSFTMTWYSSSLLAFVFSISLYCFDALINKSEFFILNVNESLVLSRRKTIFFQCKNDEYSKRNFHQIT